MANTTPASTEPTTDTPPAPQTPAAEAPAAQAPAAPAKAAPPKAKAPAVPEGAVRVKAHANLTLGRVILAVDDIGVVPDDAETRACAAADLLSVLDD